MAVWRLAVAVLIGVLEEHTWLEHQGEGMRMVDGLKQRYGHLNARDIGGCIGV